MKYDHKVKFDGVLYSAGEDVPNDKKEEEILVSDEDIVFENTETKYTFDDLSVMKVKDIKKLAEDKGISITKVIKDDVINEFLSKQV